MSIRDMVARHSKPDDNEKDFIPTPLYATRALFEVVAPGMKDPGPNASIWDPAAGEGHMLRVFKEYSYASIAGSDIRGMGERSPGLDFASPISDRATAIVTNPPYGDGLIGVFMRNGLERADRFLALLVRVQALESQGRYQEFFSRNPPTRIGFFSDRVPFRVGMLDRKAKKMFFHVWMFWDKQNPSLPGRSQMLWIPPSVSTSLSKPGDWE